MSTFNVYEWNHKRRLSEIEEQAEGKVYVVIAGRPGEAANEDWAFIIINCWKSICSSKYLFLTSFKGRFWCSERLK